MEARDAKQEHMEVVSRNRLLAALGAGDRDLLLPHVSPVSLSRGNVLFEPGDVLEWAHFPCGNTMISLVAVLPDGRTAETALIGCEGAVGGVVSSGHSRAFARAVVQITGDAWRIRLAELETAKARSRSLTDTFARYADCLLAQLLQAVACNAYHSLEQRMARSLLAIQAHHEEAELPLTHEYLGEMLGVARTYVTKTATTFQDRGLIAYARGRIRVLDQPGLEEAACPCQHILRAHYQRVLPGLYPAGTA